ncbi:Qb-SNARE [Thecamonas trahens ATCC 50062]|uniref:Qb-SNARE n=1 Tax=Thecamonas trahens ATCC 50062 TaxID=461836 RepID=A0A0L0DP64_THETB|nr:Qb-SNARE [Thecamonas trahens ATCC 50062]KNC53213.1 Qb-SNARE [Thecamonas trahens ATCC 50062]|eukprot:XP_013754682.1 Qb-SNARE [Thecamonas trahens ATCC 50062]
MGDSLFSEYASDFGDITLDISRNVYNIPSLSGAEKKDAVAETQQQLDEAESVIQQMSFELESLPRSEAARHQSKLTECEVALAKLRKEFREAKFALPKADAARSALMGDYDEEVAQRSMDQRERLLDSTRQLHRDSERIQDIQRIALETEATGGEILSTLGENREQINRMRSNLHVADANIGRGGRFIRSMQRRSVVNKLIIASIILFLVVTIILVVYFKWIKKKKKPTTQQPANSGGSGTDTNSVMAQFFSL